MRMMGLTSSGRSVALLLACVVPQVARAEGLETTVSGTIGLGRAANVARVNDFMATSLNPANLAAVPSNDLGGELRLPWLHACFDRVRDPGASYRTNDPVLGYAGSESFAPVCNEGALMPTGNLGWAQAFESGWGYGVGFFTPAAIANLKYGSDTIVTQAAQADEMLPTTANGVESPNRFLLLAREQLGGFLQAGVGVTLSPLLRLGASLGLGFAKIHNKSVASVQGGTFQDQEVLNDLHVSDWMIPRATVGLVATPLPALEVAAVLTYQGDVNASGYVDLTANGLKNAARTDCRGLDAAAPGPYCRVDGASLKVPFPRLTATLGVRYSQLRAGRTRAFDPLKDERWDIELNASWSQTSHVDAYTLTLYRGPPSARVAFSSSPDTMPLAVPGKIVIPYHWRDTFSVRAGGDYNLIAERLAVRAGLSYEHSATPTPYMNIDAWAVTRVGLHLGGTYALGKLKLSLAYAHIFLGSVSVPLEQGRVPEIVSINQQAAQSVNEGDYSGSLDVVSGQVNFAF